MSEQKISWLTQLGGFVAGTIVDHWQGTLDTQLTAYEERVDPGLPGFRGPFIYLLWHEYMSFPLGVWKAMRAALLMSKHKDADILTRVALHANFDVVRGSTNRGGVAALRRLQEKSNSMNIAITPDGPRGPRRQVAAGPIFLSSKLQIPLVCVGVGYDRPWRMKTWDRFAIARPFSRARCIGSPAMQIPANLDRKGIEAYRQRVEKMMLFLTDEAEQWAESGTRLQGQRPAFRRNPGDIAPVDSWKDVAADSAEAWKPQVVRAA